ncbi:hypothetical protein EDD86DRAFT_202183 [Gorgonomyces haynaldii]|nr:hypothetical protein EDD86DRAFT_202183 [Gorgonomyces haynaldii]
MGKYADGSEYYAVPKFDTTTDYIALILIIAVMASEIVCMLLLLRDFMLDKFYAKALYGVFICCIIWNIFKLIYVYSESPPVVNFIYSTLGVITVTVGVLVDGEILKAFLVLAKRLKPVHVTRLQIGIIIAHFTIGGGTYMRVFYLGRPFPQWLQSWYTYGYFTFTLVVQLIELWQIVMILYFVRVRMKMKQRLNTSSNLNSSSDEKDTSGLLKMMLCVLVLIIVLQWTAGAITAWDFTRKYGESNINTQIIANTLGLINPILSYVIFSAIQHISLRKPKTSSKSSQRQ